MIRRHSSKFKQGSFNNFCGVYSILNAFDHLLGDAFTSKIAKRLYTDLLRFIEAEFGSFATLKGGLEPAEMRTLTKFAARAVCVEQPRRAISVDRFRPQDEITDVGGLLELMDAELTNETIAIVGFEGRMNHWAVATGVEDRALQVLDSDVRRKMNREEIKVGNNGNNRQRRKGDGLFFMPKQTILISVTE
ncbi:hypothetical protein OO012_06545 [Rhodobacteraceae bacterium KMM 6894]|nr:hypothetical protein [Rhodobacteraceae bacterium KMM 6894]